MLEVTKHIDLRETMIFLEESCGGGSDGGDGGGGSDGGGLMKPMVRLEIGGKGSTYTHWRQFGANKIDASSECSNIWVPMFVVQTSKNICGADRKMVIFYVYLRNITKKS